MPSTVNRSPGQSGNITYDISSLADTGAQICTAGSDLLSTLKIDKDFLVSTGMSVTGITNSPVTVLGALFLEVSSNGRSTRQIVYIASGARSLILSEKALKDLGVLPKDFPCAGMFDQGPVAQQATVIVNPPGVRHSCGCLLRTEVPPLPTEPPFDDTERCCEMIRQWILDYYAASAFNINPHQLTPTLMGPDMIIKTIPGATPVASHSPIPVPH